MNESNETPAPQMPKDPFTAGSVGAAQMHEFMLTLIDAGFTRQEAFHVVSHLIIEGVRTYMFQHRGDL